MMRCRTVGRRALSIVRANCQGLTPFIQTRCGFFAFDHSYCRALFEGLLRDLPVLYQVDLIDTRRPHPQAMLVHSVWFDSTLLR